MKSREISSGSEDARRQSGPSYLLQEPQDGVTLQVRDILLQVGFLLSLVLHPVQHLMGKEVR